MDPKAAPKPGIPANLEAEVMRLAGANMSVRHIAEWLLNEHTLKVGAATVARFIAKRRTERADVTKTIVREQLAKTVNADIERLEEIRADLAKRAKKAGNRKGGLAEFVRLTQLELSAIDRKLHYAGADEPDGERAGKAPGTVNVYPAVMLPAETD